MIDKKILSSKKQGIGYNKFLHYKVDYMLHQHLPHNRRSVSIELGRNYNNKT